MHEHSGTFSPSLSITVVYSDPPDLIELETRVTSHGWSGSACAYASPDSIIEQATALEAWCQHLKSAAIIEAGADSGIGWLRLSIRRVDRAGHVVCGVALSTSGLPLNRQPDEVWRLALEFRTEIGLVEQFARSLRTAVGSLKGSATLNGLAT